MVERVGCFLAFPRPAFHSQPFHRGFFKDKLVLCFERSVRKRAFHKALRLVQTGGRGSKTPSNER